MSIPFSRYVSITSGVAAGAGVRARDLIARIFSGSAFIGPGEVLEFDKGSFDAGQVAQRFGMGSVEARMAAQYFAYVSPNGTTPQRLSFASYRATQQGAAVYGNEDYKALSTVQAASAGALGVVLGNAAPVSVGPVDMSGAASLAAAASLLQAAIIAAGVAGATVSVASSRFSVTVPDFGAMQIVVTVSGANDLATILGLTTAEGVITVQGSAAMTPVECVIASANITDNFGSLVFAAQLTEADAVQVAAWVKAQNVKYQYHIGATKATAEALQSALASYGGVGITLSPGDGTQWPELLPCSILASTDYSRRNSTQNFMYRQAAGLSSMVSDSQDADKWDAIAVNYYGDTSTAGQKIAFYQRGTLQGVATDPRDMNTYANEQWLKDAAGADLLALQLSLGRIPANAEGVGLIGNVLQAVIDRALNNGVISVGKSLNQAQRVYLTQATGDPTAWQRVQNSGYFLTVEIVPYTTPSGAVEYRAQYRLYYGKDDAIRKIEGIHSLV